MTSYSVEDDGGRGSMWDLDQKLDQPMDEEAGRLKEMYREKRFSSLLMLRLAFQSLGVVFGDLGTSPLYVLYNTFPHGISDPQDLIGALSLIIYSLTLVPLLKYVFVVLRANDNGQVLSASGGITVNNPQISKDVVILVAVIILVGLFSMQHYGSDKVGWLFAPIVLLWFLLIGTIGAVNIWKYDTSVLKAFNPIYIVRYFKGGRRNWTSLGGILLSITGTEALFADLCHFPVLAVQIAFTLVVFPCLLLAYCGQTAYIMQHQDHVFDAFYRSIPNSIYWPMFVVATAAAIIASQATISATFSIIKQALALGCFPRVKVVHTSKKFLGQIYIPDINWILLILCIAVTAGFENKSQIGNAYGTAVVLVMLVTTLLMIPVMLLVWRSHWILIILFTALSLLVELTYFSAVIFKINQGGWVPLVIAAAFLLIMYVWHYVTVKRYEFEMHSKVSMAWILGLGPSLGLVRVPGMGFVYTELASGVPRIFSHLITNLPAIHSVVVFVCVKYLPVYRVHQGERFLVKRIGPRNFHMFRCVARYGYKDLHRRDDNFEKMLFDAILDFVRYESMMESCTDSECTFDGAMNGHSIDLSSNNADTVYSNILETNNSSTDSIVPVHSPHQGVVPTKCSTLGSQTASDENDFLNRCKDAGVVHILGNTIVMARRESALVKKIAVDYIYAFLRRICRENSVMLNLPHESLLNVGQVFSV
ncbi:hypothetical protein HPP92_015812 [Vanilla planifolia]|uniref:Potassium transporter n=1 Tax=Vanilla planifolia TaxID=51239 RepID=A0A835UTL6_VANPL|nr:hypothetical protein HPP92_016427 [Vanilla planifolia]KAG0471266.1 hypothetical protein HPP92_015812 [Vanilla planifolia]